MKKLLLIVLVCLSIVVGCATATIHDLEQLGKLLEEEQYISKEMVRAKLGRPDRIINPLRPPSLPQQVYVYNLRTEPLKAGEVIVAVCSVGISLVFYKPERKTYSLRFSGMGFLIEYTESISSPFSKPLPLEMPGTRIIDPKECPRIEDWIKNGKLIEITPEMLRKWKEGENTDRYRITKDGKIELIKPKIDQEKPAKEEEENKNK